MYLTRLNIHSLRNLHEVTLFPHPQFNFFFGSNGSGKTSLLEGIHLLAVGRSFRSRQIQTLITHQKNTLACFGEMHDVHGIKTSLGIEKNRQGEVRCKVAGESCERLSVFASLLPLQLITPETFKLLVAGPEERRKFLDWGVFHVEHTFSGLCQRYQRLLKQRNAALKQSKSAKSSSLQVWEKELAAVGEKITVHRQAHLVALKPFLEEARLALLPSHPIQFGYAQGWPAGKTLEAALFDAASQDERWGYTSVGPHRAEVEVNLEGFAAHQVLSRGQQKLLVCALHLAQAQQLFAATGKKCIYLIDDLASELDSANRARLLSLLAAQQHQVFLTGVDAQGWQAVCEQFGGEMFHVEQGQIQGFCLQA